MPKALSGYRVLDFTHVLSGPIATNFLTLMGADVIKVESGAGDTMRNYGGGQVNHGLGPSFVSVNSGKRSVVLDLKSEAGLEAAHRLIAKADVVVENFRPDVKRRLGIDYKDLNKVNPRIVYGSISGFGQSGPDATRPGVDQIAQGMGGLMSITGLPGQGPVRVGIPIADLTAGLFCALGILTALHEREVSGEGQWVQTSLLQAQIFMLDFQASRWLQNHEVAKQAGNDHPTSIPTGVFKTKDGYINIAASGDHIYKRFCESVKAPELLTDPKFSSGKLRAQNRDALNAEIDKRLATFSSAELVEKLKGRRARRADLQDGRDVRRSAGPAPEDGLSGEAPQARRAEGDRPGDQHEPHQGRELDGDAGAG